MDSPEDKGNDFSFEDRLFECLITYRAKLLNADWSIRRVFFSLLILLVKRAKLLAHDCSSGCLATAYTSEKLFFCNNGVSFRDN